MDIFDTHSASVMLTGLEGPAFDDPEYIYELKLDGDRCLAYLDGSETVLVNKRSRYVLGQLPELASIHKQVSERCILDGELIIGSGLKHEFERIRSRMASTGKAKIMRGAKEHPAVFLAFDILYHDREPVLELPLLQRKELLQKIVTEGPRMALSRFVPERGKDFFDLVKAQGLEGVMAKRSDSPYRMGKRSKDWMKCKNWDRDIFVVAGYMPSEKANVVSLILAQFDEGILTYVGHVVLGRQTQAFAVIAAIPEAAPSVPIPWKDAEKAARIVWIEPRLVCQTEFMSRMPSGGFRQPVFVRLMPETAPEEAVWPEVLPGKG